MNPPALVVGALSRWPGQYDDGQEASQVDAGQADGVRAGKGGRYAGKCCAGGWLETLTAARSV